MPATVPMPGMPSVARLGGGIDTARIGSAAVHASCQEVTIYIVERLKVGGAFECPAS